ncbi:hypothetical protein RsTz2092_11150 [Deferribacterales bacterium RsTz2092]|nr:hypothetical protein AGMMS49941_12180 [Deferribacterales bacterium]
MHTKRLLLFLALSLVLHLLLFLLIRQFNGSPQSAEATKVSIISKGELSRQSGSSKAIKPKRYSSSAPPVPYNFSDMLRERGDRRTDEVGPNMNVDRIVRDYLDNHPSDDEGASFNNISDKYYAYFYKFAQSLYSVWQYPPQSAERGETGIVRVKFSILKDGRIVNISVVESSGYAALDREVLRTLKTMNNVPLPVAYEKNSLDVNGYFIYSRSGDYRLY